MEITDGSGLPGGREEMLEIIAKFRLIDDTFMTKVFEDRECAELLLRVILDRDDLTVEKTETQFELKNMYGRSTRLDIYAEDVKGKKYNIEVQRDNGGADPRRARYHSSLLDANSLKPGRKLKKLGETYVVFITEHDVLKGGKPIYTIERKIQELDDKIFGDGSHIIYVNGEIRDNTRLGRLMQDFFCTDPNKMHNEVLSRRTRYFKESEEGVECICNLLENFGRHNKREGILEEAGAVAMRLWNMGIRDYGDIAEITNISAYEVEELLSDKESVISFGEDETFCKLMEDFGEKCRESGKAEGARMIVPRLWKKGIREYEKIAEITMVPVDEVKKIIAGLSESERAFGNDFWENMAREQIDTDLKEHDDTMCDLMKDYVVKQLGIKLKNSFREKALTLWEVGSFSEEDISRLIKLPLDEVKKLLEENNA